MRTNWIGAVMGAGVLLAVPAAAVAGRTMVDHGHGATVAHDPAYDGVKTQVHAWSTRRGDTVPADGHRPAAERARSERTCTPGGAVWTRSRPAGTTSTPGASGPLSAREVWLDLTTDGDGRAVSETTRPWSIAAGTAGSVVIHAATTNPATGAAGARLLCTDVPFGE